MRRSTRTIVTVVSMLAVAAPAASARTAAEPPQMAPGAHLTQGQLHRVDGNQPVALAPDSPVEVAPVQAPVRDGGDLTPWIFVAVPLALTLAAGGARKASHKTLIPRRRHVAA